MKNILLTAINAKYIHSNPAVYSLQAYAAKRGYVASIAEYTINHSVEEILGSIYEHHPDVICFSCYIWNISYVKELVAELYKLRPKLPIWLGGPEVSFCAKELLSEYPQITGIMIGEGEQTFVELCACIENEKSIDGVAGIVWRREDGEIVENPMRELLSMDDLPFCYEKLERFENRIIYYETSRGCPFSCSYCLSSVDKKLRMRSLSLVYPELQFFFDHKVPQVKFVDRTFNCDHGHAMGIWSYLKAHDNGVTNFHFEIAADLLREDELALLETMRPGLVQFEIGVQSTHEPTIHEIRRTMNLDRLSEAVMRVHRANNIHQHLDLIAGLPFEDYETFKKSFDAVYSLRPQQLQLGFLKVLRGSYMYEQAKAYGLLYRDMPPYEVMATRWISYAQMRKLKLVEEMLEVHYNSGQFEAALGILEKQYAHPFDMYEELGAYYVKEDLLERKHSRLARSEIFYAFALKKDPEHAKEYEEALTYDLYIRENAKRRPAWAPDLTPYKKEITNLLRESGLDKRYCHVELFTCGDSPKWVIFDYENRDPWTNHAKLVSYSTES
ncbi:MAG: B12-binding domain-containing radical SAM protein [bacterium]|nr:B12-binding domain-containing radical SAM protein [bacterium]